MHGRLRKTECCLHKGNPSHTIPILSGFHCSSSEKENSSGHMERVPQLTIFPSCTKCHYTITEWGWFRYLWAPQRFHTSGDRYTHWLADITVDIVRKTRCLDDSLFWDDSIESPFWHIMEAHWVGLFNPDKFNFEENEVGFAVFLVIANGMKLMKKMTEAILHFPTFTSVMSVRSWFGLANQVSHAFSQLRWLLPSWNYHAWRTENFIGMKCLTNFLRSWS